MKFQRSTHIPFLVVNMQQTEHRHAQACTSFLLFVALSVYPLLGWPGALSTAPLMVKVALEVNYWYRNSGDVGAAGVDASHIITHANGHVVLEHTERA